MIFQKSAKMTLQYGPLEASSTPSGAVQSLRWGCLISMVGQKEQPHTPGTKFYAQIANCLQDICITCSLKHIFISLTGILDILKHHNCSNGVSL